MPSKAPAAFAASALLAMGTTALATAAPSLASGAESEMGDYIVVLDNGAASQRVADAHAARFGVDVGHVYGTAIDGYAAKMSPATADLVAKTPAVEWVQRDRAVRATAQSTPTGINRAQGDASPTANINGVDQRVNADVAVIDTGADLTHPDLNIYRAGAKNCSVGAVNANDLNGHGTHVSGTVGAVDNGSGVVGMAPGARIWPVKVLTDAGTGLNSDVICGIDYVTAHADQIEVANMSLGGGGSDDRNCGNSNNDAMHKAICRSVGAGITYAVAAGNDSENAANSTPAAYDEVITVSALADFNGQPGGGAASTCRNDQDDTFANFSNFGADVDIIAPGVCINSSWIAGGYNTISGTSMASPHVAGAAALYKANNPAATPAQVKAALRNSGSTTWSSADDGDNTKEPLLDASTF
ncbi:MAG: Alkaline serine exoprotease A precursor [uncultured Nocardioidaceae bacterium]|uniref:Alkaline serine exoprotease A n=1 Tax=uncultured Nocardioidaceae bacterium TaxID=253824 RepID=A0A6J4M2C7_9ACTN|nr:MAG: Alkaline serine exoprotease A precursor [uncultured Nocardioidaceae bacterium]